jgi:FkbM family methyltransferase
MWFGHTVFLIRLFAGRSVGWTAQARDDHAVPLALAARQLWPQTLLGLASLTTLAVTVPAAIPYALFIAGGLALSIPLAVITAAPGLGRTLVATGFCRLPEEIAPPAELAALKLPAIEAAAEAAAGLTLREQTRATIGALRSLRIYYLDRKRSAAMARLYAQFVRPGELVFDVGAHVGDRVACFRKLGARVVAVEPQPVVLKVLRLLYGRDRAVAIEPQAVGRVTGNVELKLNLANPTVSSASSAFIEAAAGAPGWEGQAWTRSIRVGVTTLDALIARHGRPSFIKIDVEGFEADALAGLSHLVPALSFEFTTIAREVALACIARCRALGFVRFNAALGESQVMVHPDWCSSDAIEAWLKSLPDAANSGDIYAVRT